jgi:hypothetical protein
MYTSMKKRINTSSRKTHWVIINLDTTTMLWPLKDFTGPCVGGGKNSRYTSVMPKPKYLCGHCSIVDP